MCCIIPAGGHLLLPRGPNLIILRVRFGLQARVWELRDCQWSVNSDNDLTSVIARDLNSVFFLPFSHRSDRLACFFFPPCTIFFCLFKYYLWSFTSLFNTWRCFDLKLGTLERRLTGRLTDTASCKWYCWAACSQGMADQRPVGIRFSLRALASGSREDGNRHQLS